MTDSENPLSLYPSDGPLTLATTEKLIGVANYRSWQRSFEINLSTRRKLGFLLGKVPEPTEDPMKIEMWETCNNMVISWLLNSVSDSIKNSILYVQNACDMWSQLKKRFSVSNGSRKYKVNREIHELRQNSESVNEYHTNMKSLWEELEAE